MTMRTESGTSQADFWALALAAAALLAVTMGSRTSLGLFVLPIAGATGLGVASVSLAVAFSQLAWGAAQPIAGAFADRYGAGRVVACGAIGLAVAHLLIPYAASGASLAVALAMLGAAGAAAGSNSVLLSAVARRVAPERQGFASGIVGAGGPVGQLAFAPTVQAIIAGGGWASAMFALAGLSLATLPIARRFHAATATKLERPASPARSTSALAALSAACRSPSYWAVTGAFFVCGFHVAFLLAHMPGVVEVCGLPPAMSGVTLAVIGLFNIVSSIGAGYAVQRVSMKHMLAALYAARGLGIAVFLAAPRTELTVLAFAAWMGLTYMATLPPTAGLIGKLFGTANLGTVLGMTMLVHQIGSFLGVWLGGVAVERTGGYGWIWYADLALAATAALVCLAIRDREAKGNAAPRRWVQLGVQRG
jgi:predicted MFS family arabinose efflux permease